MKLLPVILALLCAAAGAAPEPFIADYRVLRGSMHIADARMELSRDDEDGWTLRSTTEPVAFFRMITNDVIVETSSFRFGETGPIPLHYRYEQRHSSKDRDEIYAFDWAAGRVVGTARGKPVELVVPRGTLDPLLLRIAVGEAVAHGTLAPVYSVVERSKLNSYAVARSSAKRVKVPAGEYDVEGVARVSEDGRKTTRLEYAEVLAWLPVVIEHLETGKPTYRLELTKVTRN